LTWCETGEFKVHWNGVGLGMRLWRCAVLWFIAIKSLKVYLHNMTQKIGSILIFVFCRTTHLMSYGIILTNICWIVWIPHYLLPLGAKKVADLAKWTFFSFLLPLKLLFHTQQPREDTGFMNIWALAKTINLRGVRGSEGW
jgi:hypothetical protein